MKAEEKTKEQLIQEQKQLIETIIDHIPNSIFWKNRDSVYVGGNQHFINTFGQGKPENIIGKSVRDLSISEEQMALALETDRKVVEEGQSLINYEERVATPDGQEIVSLTSKAPLRDKAGTIVGLVTVTNDITERVRAEEALRESEERLQLALEAATDGLFDWNMQTGEVYFSPRYYTMLGYEPYEIPASYDTWINLLHPDDREYAVNIVKEHIEEKRDGHEIEFRLRTKSGGWRWILSRGRVIERDASGKAVRMVGTHVDITERRQLEAQLLQAQKMEAIGQLAAGICHDFNNLLTPIGGFAELLLGKTPEGSQQQEHLRQIRVAAERAAALTGQLLLFTRQARGERRSVQLNSVVEETRDLLERSLPKKITVELRLASELWAVEADSSQISQVLMNLCVNARDAMPDGGTLTLETRNVTLDKEYAQAMLEARPGRYVCLSVSDTGGGMSLEVQARLFEPFFTTKEVGKGTGLGLAVVYGIVKGHGGFINVYSQEGRGSTLHVYLPAIELAVEGREIEGLELPTGTETILLVDDEEMVRALGQAVLEPCGYTVLMAEDGLQALEVYQAHQGEIALVVLDVIMPQMGGLECLRRLREMDPQVRVLISTGYTVKGLAQELVAEGALEVVEKPFRIQDFAAAVRAALDKS